MAEGAGVEGFLGPCVVWGSAKSSWLNKTDWEEKDMGDKSRRKRRQ
jgi:hypothetical protein